MSFIRSCASIGATVLAVLVFATATRASVTLALDLQEMTYRADLVVVGRVLEQAPRWDARRRIVTDVSLRAEEVIKGQARIGDVVRVMRLGGAIGELAMKIEGEASFTDGERVLVFLRRVPGTGELRTVGMAQGVLSMTREGSTEMVTPRDSGLELMRRGPDGALLPAPGALSSRRPAREVIEELRSYVGRR